MVGWFLVFYSLSLFVEKDSYTLPSNFRKKDLTRPFFHEIIIVTMSKEQVKKSKVYRNQAEQQFAQTATNLGWFVTKRGYPDFICYLPNGELAFVEVKTKSTHKLHKDQWRVMNALKNKGIWCYRWSPDKDWLSNGENGKL